MDFYIPSHHQKKNRYSTVNLIDMNLKDMSGMLKQVQQMTEKMQTVQKELEKKTVSAESGGGMVKVVANGKHELVSIDIEKDLLKPDDADMLQDLILAAANQALAEAAKMAQEEVSKVTGGMMGAGGMDFLKEMGFGGKA
jgi:nucleoid-associated protein EbfC